MFYIYTLAICFGSVNIYKQTGKFNQSFSAD